MTLSPTITETTIDLRASWGNSIVLRIDPARTLIAISEEWQERGWSLRLARVALRRNLFTPSEAKAWRESLEGNPSPLVLTPELEQSYLRVLDAHAVIIVDGIPIKRHAATIRAGARIVLALSSDLTRSWSDKWVVARGRTRNKITLK